MLTSVYALGIITAQVMPIDNPILPILLHLQ
jgi:hypothetical protein